jgi:hypothetical protein
MKKLTIISVTAMILLLPGCATNRDTGALVGGVAGGIIGNQVGGGTGRVIATGVGAAVGSAVGSAVGDDMDRNRRTPAPVVVREIYPSTVERCMLYVPGTGEHTACERGARQRMTEEQRRREQEAYRQGYGR